MLLILPVVHVLQLNLWLLSQLSWIQVSIQGLSAVICMCSTCVSIVDMDVTEQHMKLSLSSELTELRWPLLFHVQGTQVKAITT